MTRRENRLVSALCALLAAGGEMAAGGYGGVRSCGFGTARTEQGRAVPWLSGLSQRRVELRHHLTAKLQDPAEVHSGQRSLEQPGSGLAGLPLRG